MAKHHAPKQRMLSVAARVLGIDANTEYDLATQDTYQYREANVYPYFTLKGFTVDKCQGPIANATDVESKALLAGVVYITGSGHGEPAVFHGYLLNSVFEVGAYSTPAVTGKIVHLTSCQTAQELGPDMVSKGCLAYFAYEEDFLYPTTAKDTFFECDAEIDKAFADGLTAAAVYARVKALFKQRADEFLAKGTDLDLNHSAALTLLCGKLRCPSFPPPPNDYGDETAKLA